MSSAWWLLGRLDLFLKLETYSTDSSWSGRRLNKKDMTDRVYIVSSARPGELTQTAS
jgi:hypothetical protein